jgi:hypothetical protein
MSRRFRFPKRQFAVAMLLLALVAIVAWRVALHRIEGAVADALGPRGSVGSVEIGWGGVEVRDLRLRAGPGWPAPDELRAASVVVVPDLRSALFGDWRVRSITVSQAHISAQRSLDGHLLVVPSLLGRGLAGRSSVGAAPNIVVDRVVLSDALIALYDTTLTPPARPLQIEKIRADIGPLRLPDLDHQVALRVDGRFHGPSRDGAVRLLGSLNPSTREGHLDAQLRNIDLVALQPYLFQRLPAGTVRDGWVDLNVSAVVEDHQLHAPGTLTLSAAEVVDDPKLPGLFGGLKTRLVREALLRDGRIEVPFTVTGSLQDPGFSLNDTLARRVAGGLADALSSGAEPKALATAGAAATAARDAMAGFARENVKQQARQMVSGMLER